MKKFLFAISFMVPVLFFSLSNAIIVSLIWGMSILFALSYIIARSQGETPFKIIGEHLMIALVVIAITHWVGDWLSTLGA